jgi:hypothetical protein
MKNGGVLFEVNSAQAIGDSTASYSDYRLAEWVTITVGGMTTGSWRTAIWSTDSSAAPAESGTSIKVNSTDVLTFTNKGTFTMEAIQRTWKNYILSISYDTALTTLRALWGDPSSGWSIIGGGTNTDNARNNNGVLFQVATFSFSSGTYTDYRLVKVVNGVWRGVGWDRY